MAFAGANWDAVNSTNQLPFSYDFSLRMDPSDSITSVVWTFTVAPTTAYPGADPTPNARIIATNHSAHVAEIWLATLVPTCRYLLLAAIQTADGIHDNLWAYLYCDPLP